MKNRILLIFIAVILSLPVYVQAEDSITVPDTPLPVEEQITENYDNENNTVQNLDDDNQVNEEPNIVNNLHYDFKQPISKRSLLKKLLKAFLGVIISLILIYFMLTIYNRFRDSNISGTKTSEGNVNLDLPDNLNDAVKTFLEKTKWE